MTIYKVMILGENSKWTTVSTHGVKSWAEEAVVKLEAKGVVVKIVLKK